MTPTEPLSELAHKLTLSVSEAAALTGFGRHAILEAINTGALVAVRPGKREFRINREELDAWRKALPVVPIERASKLVALGAARS